MTPEGLSPIRRALVSVSDKSGLAEFAGFLHARGVEILSTGGSARTLTEAGIPVVEVSAYSGFPEIMDGRVKTLHPKIHGGILARRDLESHRGAMTDHGIVAIDLVVANLYPFEATLDSGADEASCIENIDIGGPAMARAAAKNHEFVTLVTNPKDYQAVIDEMTAHDGATSFALRRRLAAAGFAHTAAYDARIAAWYEELRGETFPERLVFAATRQRILRYGENPHQAAAFYAGGKARAGVANAEQTQGKALSYNNLNDADAGFELVCEFAAPEFDRPAVAIIKHANPCGAALGDSLVEAYGRALACDPVSAFGGIIAVNRRLDAATAAEITKLFAEVVIAPEIAPEARRILAEKTKLRVLVTGAMADPADSGPVIRSLAGGYLLQSRDNGRMTEDELKVVTKRPPSAAERADLLFAFRVAKHVKSNAIVYARDGATVGIGAGQMSRVDSAHIAARKAREMAPNPGGAGEARGAAGSVVASDAFFPFADGLLTAIEAGASAVIQPGGSIRDREVIATADEAGVAMVFTGLRHFRH